MRFCRLALLLSLAAVSASAQNTAPLAAPGLRVPGGSVPYALDAYAGKPELVPVHHSAVQINNHKGANVAGSLAGSFFYKPKLTFEVEGAHARTVLHAPTPSFYVHTMDDPGGDSSDEPVFAILRAVPDKDRRVFAKVQFTQLTGNAKRSGDGVVETTTERLPGGWLKITPTAPLPTGEYAFSPIEKAQNAFSTVVFDFAIDPAAANATDAVPAQGDVD